MTTPRHRRNKIEQARDTLLAMLQRQQSDAMKDWHRYEISRDAVIATRTALRALGWEPPTLDTPVLADKSIQPLPGMEAYGPTDTTSTSPVIDVKSEAAKDTPVLAGGVSSGFAIEQVIGAVERAITMPFRAPPLKPSTCPHAKTHKVDGVTRCLECGERVVRTGE